MDRPFVGGADKKYEEGWTRVFKKSPKERFMHIIHKFIVRLILGRKI